MDTLLVVINAAILVFLIILTCLVFSIKKSLGSKKDKPNDEDTRPPLPTAQDGGDGDKPNDPLPPQPPLPT